MPLCISINAQKWRYFFATETSGARIFQELVYVYRRKVLNKTITIEDRIIFGVGVSVPIIRVTTPTCSLSGGKMKMIHTFVKRMERFRKILYFVFAFRKRFNASR